LARDGNKSFLPDFLHPSSITPTHPNGVYTVIATGNRQLDRIDLLSQIGIDNPGRDWIAHHISYDPVTNTMQMQLVDQVAHRPAHVGGVNDFQIDTGTKYGTSAATTEAQRRTEAINSNAITTGAYR
jgi:hypothetical protein